MKTLDNLETVAIELTTRGSVLLDQVEGSAIDIAVRAGPWLAPVPTAYLVGRASKVHLMWPTWVAGAAAVAVEILGLATVTTALQLRAYNKTKRKTDPLAPFWLAASLAGVYLVIAIGMTVVMDIVEGLQVYSPAVFPLLSLMGGVIIAIRHDHRLRLKGIEQDKEEKRQARREKKETLRKVKTYAAVCDICDWERDGYDQEWKAKNALRRHKTIHDREDGDF